jgi:hypothetical protein
MIRLRAAGAVAAAVFSAACGAQLQKLPAGAGAPAADAAAALTEATEACSRVTSLTAELAVSGRANGQRLRGRVLAGLAAPASVYLDAVAPFGASVFIYAAANDAATLLLPRDARVLRHGDPAAVLAAVTGVPLGAADLRMTLTGCLSGTQGTGRQFGEAWRSVTGADHQAWLHRQTRREPWRLVAVVHRPGGEAEWRADYSDFQDHLPRTVHLISADGRRFDLHLGLSQVEVNVPLGADVFEVKVPASAQPITLEELQRSGSLASQSRDE